MANKYHARFKDAPWYRSYDIVVGGAGGIGSWASFLLARSGHNLHIFDFDTVEIDNLGGQLFMHGQQGLKKTAAISSVITNFTVDVPINTFEKFTEESGFGTRIMFSCFDNMTARKVFFDKWLKTYHETERDRALYINSKGDPEMVAGCAGPGVFIDARLEAETGIIYCIKNEEEAKKWQEEWFPDEKVADAPCTFRATSHNAAIIAGLMVANLNNVITNHVEGMDMRVTPWKTTYELPTMTFNAEEIQQNVAT